MKQVDFICAKVTGLVSTLEFAPLLGKANPCFEEAHTMNTSSLPSKGWGSQISWEMLLLQVSHQRRSQPWLASFLLSGENHNWATHWICIPQKPWGQWHQLFQSTKLVVICFAQIDNRLYYSLEKSPSKWSKSKGDKRWKEKKYHCLWK